MILSSNQFTLTGHGNLVSKIGYLKICLNSTVEGGSEPRLVEVGVNKVTIYLPWKPDIIELATCYLSEVVLEINQVISQTL